MKKRRLGFWAGIPFSVVLLGLASLLTDLSSELVVPLIPLFMTSLGAGGLIIGILGGLSDSVVSILQAFSGYWSDKVGKRKPFIIFGYSLSAVTKLFMSLSTSWIHLFILRPIERIGKGMRDPPRDALLAETTKKRIHGKVFGIHRALDATGGIFGSILAFIFLTLGFVYSKIFFIASLIAFTSLIPLFFIKERRNHPHKISFKISLKKLPRNLKLFIFVASLFALANFNSILFILKASQFLPATTVVLLFAVFYLFFELFSIPAGILADKITEKRVILYGYILFSFVCLIFAFANSLPAVIAGFVLYGISYACIIGNQRAFAADLASKELGTSIGTFHTFISIASLPAGIIAGALWQYVSPSAPFLCSALIAVITAVIFSYIKFDGDKNGMPAKRK